MQFPDYPDLFKVTIGGTYLDVKWANVFHYRNSSVTPQVFSLMPEAFWNHIKTEYRFVINEAAGDFFETISVEQLGGERLFVDYSIPSNERTGTRGGSGELSPSFMSAGLRMNVSSRKTRPGQKRIPLTGENLFSGQSVLTSVREALQNLAIKFSGEVEITIPGGATFFLQPVVVSFAPFRNPPVVWQPITSATASPFVTTQNTRKRGRGE